MSATDQLIQASRIRVLPDLLVNKIAAGEVVERPSSVVKELMENALDAGATRIAVTIEDGGRQLIRVTDDGCGMSPEDLRLAVTPHATSKVLVEEDLYSIQTMGFRGEALASIAAISKMRIVSRPAGSIAGHEIRMSGDQFESAGAAGCPEGTTVEVRDLFFNVPARRKFLKSPSTEVGHINEQFARIALAHPPIGFELTNNKRVSQNLPACDDRIQRIAKFYSPELAAALMRIERDERGLRLEIYAAPPAQSRATAQWQYIFVNGRFVRDRFIQHAIREAYRGLMEPDRHSVVFLFITIDPAEVDVNVHPTKVEVRWADSNLIHSQVLSALRETFQGRDLTPMLRTDRAQPPVDPAEQDRIRREFAESMRAMTPIQPGSQPAVYGGRFENEFDRVGHGGFDQARYKGRFGSDGCLIDESWRSLYAPPSAIASAGPGSPDVGSGVQHGAGTGGGPGGAPPPAGSAHLADGLRPPRTVQMHNLYLVAETSEGIVIVDQHALHERIMYEQLRARFTAGALESQRLLLPETVRVTPQQAALLDEHAELLRQLGIEVTAFGADCVGVQSFPALLKDAPVAAFMIDLLDLLSRQPQHGEAADAAGRAAHAEVVIHKVLDLMACKAAVKAGDPLTPEEIEALMRQRHLIEKSSSCPHGRPTMLRLTKEDLNRQFKRT
jgi:DNA mismatch repair protein MutL